MSKIQSILRSTIIKFSTYSSPSNRVQVYNNNFEYLCGDTAMNISLMGPSHKHIDDSTVMIRSFNSMTMRCVHRKDLYVKGSIRISQSFNLGNIKDLLTFKF